ncbi:MAG: hypothetical protein DRN03_02450 [Thermoplasmata archaeon]|nr:MAG: hypothetical protein DRN03_02450 [Thermoplasmata archaeon]
MVRGMFRRPSFHELAGQISRMLASQRGRLRLAMRSLERQRQRLWKLCLEAVSANDYARALVYANELSVVKHVLQVFTQCDILMERLIIRLDMLKSLNAVVSDLAPVASELKVLSKHIAKVMPSLSYELEKIGDTISDVLSETSVNTLEPPTPIDEPGSEEILSEARAELERRMAEKFPTPPETVDVHSGRTVALALGADGQASNDYGGGEGEILERVYSYAKMKGGDVDIAECASELNLPPERVLWALQRLSQEGRVELRR